LVLNESSPGSFWSAKKKFRENWRLKEYVLIYTNMFILYSHAFILLMAFPSILY
jgi:hypothetical protein